MKKIVTSLSIAFITFTGIAQTGKRVANLKSNVQFNTSVAQLAIEEKSETPKRKCSTPILNEAYETWVQKEIQKQEQFANGKKSSSSI